MRPSAGVALLFMMNLASQLRCRSTSDFADGSKTASMRRSTSCQGVPRCTAMGGSPAPSPAAAARTTTAARLLLQPFAALAHTAARGVAAKVGALRLLNVKLLLRTAAVGPLRHAAAEAGDAAMPPQG